MSEYKKAMDNIVLSSEADARIYRELLRASAQKNAERPRSADYLSVRRFRTVLIAAVLILAFGVTAYAAGARILMKITNSGSGVSVNYGTVDSDFIEFGTWLPSDIPAGYEMSFVSDPFYGEQNIIYTDGNEKTIRFAYAKAGQFGEVSLENVLREEDVEINGCAGKLYTQKNSQSIFWTNDTAGIGFWLHTDDTSLDLTAIAKSVAVTDTVLTPTLNEDTALALEELGDRTPAVPEAYASVSVTGSPTASGGGWYGYIRKTFTDKTANKSIFLGYETYASDDGRELSADEVLALMNVPGTSVSVNGLPGILAKDGSSVRWVDTEHHLEFTLTADDIKGDALLALANSVQ